MGLGENDNIINKSKQPHLWSTVDRLTSGLLLACSTYLFHIVSMIMMIRAPMWASMAVMQVSDLGKGVELVKHLLSWWSCSFSEAWWSGPVCAPHQKNACLEQALPSIRRPFFFLSFFFWAKISYPDQCKRGKSGKGPRDRSDSNLPAVAAQVKCGCSELPVWSYTQREILSWRV